MKKWIFSALLGVFLFVNASAQSIIRVPLVKGDATKVLQEAIERARKHKGKPVVIALEQGDYHISRQCASQVLYYVSNTASEQENPDQTKHIGLWMKGLKNVVFDGGGARLITHGEMTSFVIDGCQNIVLKNFTLAAADPTVPEFTVEQVLDDAMVVRVHPLSKYQKSSDGQFSFIGDGWTLSKGIAQCYDPKSDITWRSWSPLNDIKEVVLRADSTVLLRYATRPNTKPGEVFQMRDAIRDQVCGLINQSKDICLEQIQFEFLGNFGIVAQVSENITYRNLAFEPNPAQGRTCAGFADFLQVSGCKGMVCIENNRFVGAHDDPINIHGTHLKVVRWSAPDQVVLAYRHPQTYGFSSFHVGDTVEMVDENSLLQVGDPLVVKEVIQQDARKWVVTFEKAPSQEMTKREDLVVENISYTPDVVIRNNFFSRVPTRGVLVTTRGRVLIENNIFYRMQMSGILIADDARSWFESGCVRDVTIQNNRFIECGSPVVYIAPENNVNKGFVHRNIRILYNRFELRSPCAVSAKSVDGLIVVGNIFKTKEPVDIKQIIQVNECGRVQIEKNLQI